jgi:hypothetical protein
MAKGTFDGANLSKKCIFCNNNPSKFNPINADIDKKKVIDNVLVKLLTKGINPNIFNNKIKMNKVNKNGLYFIKFLLVFLIIFKTKQIILK